jgi:hypothetical protein
MSAGFVVRTVWSANRDCVAGLTCPSAGGLDFPFARWQTRTSQIEVVGHVWNHLCSVETNLAFANSAKRELLAANGQHLVIGPVDFMNHVVDAGDWHHLSRFVSATFAIYGERHKSVVSANLPGWRTAALEAGGRRWMERSIPGPSTCGRSIVALAHRRLKILRTGGLAGIDKEGHQLIHIHNEKTCVDVMPKGERELSSTLTDC